MASRPREVQRCGDGIRVVELLSGRIGVGWWFPSVAGFLHLHVRFGCRSVGRDAIKRKCGTRVQPLPPLYIKAPLFQTRVRQIQNCPPSMENVLNKSTSLFMTDDELGQLCPEISK